jgi:hypothetical protein
MRELIFHPAEKSQNDIKGIPKASFGFPEALVLFPFLCPIHSSVWLRFAHDSSSFTQNLFFWE